MRRAVLIHLCLVAFLAGSASEVVAQSKCTALKYLFSGKAAFLTAKCKFKAANKGEAVDPDCIAKVQSFLDKKWPAAENKGDCLSSDDQATIQADIDNFLSELEDDLGTPTAATCGNNIKEAGEECDGTDNLCVSGFGKCQSDCTCGQCTCTNVPSASCLDCVATCIANTPGCTIELCGAACFDSCCSAAEVDCADQGLPDCIGTPSECLCFANVGIAECGCTCDCVP